MNHVRGQVYASNSMDDTTPGLGPFLPCIPVVVLAEAEALDIGEGAKISDETTWPSLFALLCICHPPTANASCCSVSVLQAYRSTGVVASPRTFAATYSSNDLTGGMIVTTPVDGGRAAADNVGALSENGSSSWLSEVVPVEDAHRGTSHSHFVRLISPPSRAARGLLPRDWTIRLSSCAAPVAQPPFLHADEVA